jgi:hypothetical protein
MPRKPRFKDPDDAKLREDTAETAYRTLQEATGERPKTVPPSERSADEKDQAAVERGRKGGRRRADTLTPDELRRIAEQGAEARWADRDREAQPEKPTDH